MKRNLEKEDHILVKNLKYTVTDLYELAYEKFNYYGSRLTEKESEIGSIIKYKLSKIFNSEEIEEKDLFLVGIENSDFTKEKQI